MIKFANVVRLILVLLAVAGVAVASCMIVFYGFLRPELPVTHRHESYVERLALDDASKQALEAIDRAYDAQRDEIGIRFRVAISDLAEILETEEAFNESVAVAIRNVHAVHGELQALSVERYFDILANLPEEHHLEFRRMAAEALSHPE